MCRHAGNCAPDEACGILAGKGEAVSRVLTVTNVLHSAVRFQMNPDEQLQALLDLEERGEEMIGYFHSHPVGPAVPSATDLEMYYYPGAVMVILGCENGIWKPHAFLTDGKCVREIGIRVI